MDTNYLENNYLTLVGKVTGEKRFSHEIYGERFYIFDLSIPRLSGNADIIPITVSERLITDEMLQEGKKLLVKGQFRSYNSYENEKNRLILTVFAKDVTELEEDEQEENEISSKLYWDAIEYIIINKYSICILPKNFAHFAIYIEINAKNNVYKALKKFNKLDLLIDNSI